MNKIAPLTIKQTNYLKRTVNSWFNVAEGGKRGGKNVLQTLAFCIALENHPNRLHLVSGVSTATARLNILDCDGFGMLNFFSGRCREGEYQNRACLYIQGRTGEKIVLISGGGKKGDEKLIKGNTYGMAYVTEANECSQIFIQEVFDRTLSSRDRKVFHDLNPKAEAHWYYSELLNFHEEKQRSNPNYGYNYGHFTIADNMSVTDEELRIRMDSYDKGSVWYARDILGKRKQAEGAIYRKFVDNTESFLLDTVPSNIILVNIGVDFGGNGSASFFVATGFTSNYRDVVVLEEENRPAGSEDPETLSKGYVAFCKTVIDKYPNVFIAYADSAEQILIRGLRLAVVRDSLPIQVENAKKGEIVDRIRLVNLLMGQGRFFIMRKCKYVIKAFESAVWDKKKAPEDVRLDDGSYNMDAIDATEYTIEPVTKKLQILGGITSSGATS